MSQRAVRDADQWLYGVRHFVARHGAGYEFCCEASYGNRVISVTDTSPKSIDSLTAHILAYLAGNPHAADTVEGIQSWWLSGAAADVSVVDVECAILALMQRGELECRTLADGTRVYARPPLAPAARRHPEVRPTHSPSKPPAQKKTS